MFIASWFRNRPVSVKVIFVSVCILGVTAALGAVSINALSSVNGRAADLRDNWLPAERFLGDVEFATMRFRQVQAVYLFHASEAEHAADLKELNSIEREIAAAENEYEHLIDQGEERQLAEAYRAKWKAYAATQARLTDVLKRDGRETAMQFSRDQRKLRSSISLTLFKRALRFRQFTARK